MSLPQINTLKPRQSLDLIIDSRQPENFTTVNVNHFCSMEFGGWGVGARVINNDAIATCTVRLHSNRGTAIIIPVASEIEINEWFDIIIIEPNAVTGNGQLELDIVPFKEARRRG